MKQPLGFRHSARFPECRTVDVNIQIDSNRKLNMSSEFSQLIKNRACAADFSLLNLPKGKSLGRSKPATNS